ncbi:ovocalyxin-32 [Meleagris gallopavo]|uniref:ovocalyxin-32 n=1 Tax=Meleagris gallopavo TaxID=9103 RepID=UPI000549DB0F|nr:ovocalyxin-32 [Meleagris gallopavo]
MPGLGAALPAAALLLLLSSFPPAAAEQPLWPFAPGVMHALNPSDRQASKAAWVALHYANFKAASPSLLRVLGQVQKVLGIKAALPSLHSAIRLHCRLNLPLFQFIQGVGMKYYLHFTTDDYINGENAGSCLATVLYLKRSPPEVNIKCADIQDKKQIQEQDNRFYQYLQHRTKPIIANDIPDSHGNIAHAHLPLWGLAVAGGSFIMLKKSTENLGYFLAQVKAVKQQIRKNNAVELEFMILLHETPTQKIYPCYMHLIWILDHPLTLKYICTSVNHWLEDGSGQDYGSAAGMFHEKEGNF